MLPKSSSVCQYTPLLPLSRVTVSIKYNIVFGRLVLEINTANIFSPEDNDIKLSFKYCKAILKH